MYARVEEMGEFSNDDGFRWSDSVSIITALVRSVVGRRAE